MTGRGAMIAAILEQVAGIGRDLTGARSRPFGQLRLSKSQLDALFVLAHTRGPVTAGGLASALSVTPGAVTQLVAGLREHGLVEISADAEDGRVRVIRLTPDTRARVDAFEQEAVERLAPTFAGLDDTELQQLAALLNKRTERS